MKEHDFPDKKFVTDMYVHNLERLFELNGALWDALQADMRIDAELNANWRTVKDWDDGKRYDIVGGLEALALYEASTDAGSGVMEWIRGRW